MMIYYVILPVQRRTQGDVAAAVSKWEYHRAKVNILLYKPSLSEKTLFSGLRRPRMLGKICMPSVLFPPQSLTSWAGTKLEAT
jgi:hypothetical protein